MSHEVVQSSLEFVDFLAHGDSRRKEVCLHWFAHGRRQERVATDYFLTYPEDIPHYAVLEHIQLGARYHDCGKGTCTTDSGVWFLEFTKMTDDERKEIRRHVSEGAKQLTAWYASRGLVVPQATLEYASQHHEKLNGEGYPAKLRGDQISFVGQFALIADHLVSTCEDREYRYKRNQPPHAFVEIFDIMYHKPKIYNHVILEKFWELYRNNPLIFEPSVAWIFRQNA